MLKMKRLARYLLQLPRTILEYKPRVEDDGIIDVYSDSDWAGCIRTRKSTSGGVMVLGNGVVKAWSSTQTTTAQSSGEAEYYALVRAAAEGFVHAIGDAGLGVEGARAIVGGLISCQVNCFKNWSWQGQAP